MAIKSKIGVNIFFWPKAFRKNFEIEKNQDDGVDQLQSISTMHGKTVNRMRARTIWIVSDGQTIQKQVPLDVVSHKVCVGIWFAKKLELFETFMGSK